MCLAHASAVFHRKEKPLRRHVQLTLARRVELSTLDERVAGKQMAVFDLIGRHAVPRNAVIEKPCYLRHVERTGNHQNFVYPAFVRHVID
ncbi:MAG: hypothetical protein IJ146_06470, partial [Kiritimatiellae bacterium]|nr:hypothetical protein [Kiritimatiellia bacterium]